MSAARVLHSPEQALERLQGLPGGPELLAAARRHEDLALVGGAVRDLLLGHWPRELDVTLDGGSAELARELAASISPSERPYGQPVEPVLHQRFGTASLAWAYGRIDIAERRAESYARPGALPDVRPGTPAEDLARRDFTVNALTLALAGRTRGRLESVEGALEDLAAGRLRVLHERSFLDDPTRLLRLARYSARLGFEIEPPTRALAGEALAAGALDTVSGPRVGAELWLAAREGDGAAALAALQRLGVLRALGVSEPFEETLAREALALLPPDGSRDVLLLGLALRLPESAAQELLRRLGLTASERRAVLPVAAGLDALAQLILDSVREGRPLEAERAGPEQLAAAGALAARESPLAAPAVRRWLACERHVELEIDGEDLVAAGVPRGPEVGIRLRAALRCKREGLAESREEELRAALAAELGSEPAAGGRL